MRFHQGGKFVPGINYRLAYGWDFGSSCSGPDLAIAAPERRAKLRADFAHIRAFGYRAIRWFIFNDGRNGIRFAGQTPVGFEPIALQSANAALEEAAAAGLHILFVLLDHTFCFNTVAIPGSLMLKQGHGHVLKQVRLFDALLGNVIGPWIAELGDHPNLLGYELINEPEMVMRRREWPLGKPSGVGCPYVPLQEQLTLAEARDRLERTRDLVHCLTAAQFSIGSMDTRWIAHWPKLIDPSRDFLTFHYYAQDHERDIERAFENRILPLAEKMAVGLGEFYAYPLPQWPNIPVEQFMRLATRYGLQTAMPWVYNPGSGDPNANVDPSVALQLCE